MTTDAGSGFDNQAAGRATGDDRLEEESRHLIADDADAEVIEEEYQRDEAQDRLNEAF